MKQTSGPAKKPAEAVIKDIRRATRRQFSSEEKIRVVLEGLRGEDSIAELCRREGIAASMYYGWSKEFLEAGKKRLSGDPNGHARHARDCRPGGRTAAARAPTGDLGFALGANCRADGGGDRREGALRRELVAAQPADGGRQG